MCYLLKVNEWKFYVIPLKDKENVGTPDICEGKKKEQNKWKQFQYIKEDNFYGIKVVLKRHDVSQENCGADQ